MENTNIWETDGEGSERQGERAAREGGDAKRACHVRKEKGGFTRGTWGNLGVLIWFIIMYERM